MIPDACAPVRSITASYDAVNRLTSVGGVAYQWDGNGNLTGDGQRTYAYDAANRLKATTLGADVTTYAYNGLGDRLEQSVNGTVQRYMLDLNAGLTQVLSDGASTYVYGGERIAQFTGDQAGYFLGDALGSVRQVADASGLPALERSYAPYGAVLSSRGSAASAYGYTGEWTDASGLVNLRARYYAPYLNQFIQPDTIIPEPYVPRDWNRYMYVRGNPVNFIDPGGMCIDINRDDKCDEILSPRGYSAYILAKFEGRFTGADKGAIESALWDVGMAYSKAFSTELARRMSPCIDVVLLAGIHSRKLDPVSALKILHNGMITFSKRGEKVGYWGLAVSYREINIYKNGTLASVRCDIGRYKRFIVHEMAHAFEYALLETLGARLGRDTLGKKDYKDLITPKMNNNPKNGNGIYNGFAGGDSDWQWRLYEDRLVPSEIFADMYIGWVYDKWEEEERSISPWFLIPIAQKRSNFMKDHMESWVYKAIQTRLGRKVD